jgi:16S rRNA (uracil1498-N3)-methyltransferase
MPDTVPKIRLHVPGNLAAGGEAVLARAQAHYLRNVMRCRPGDPVALFNGRDGEWRGEIAGYGKDGASVRLSERLHPPADEPGPWLVFAPVKRGPLELVVEKATELGAARLMPVATRRTVVGRLNAARLAAIATEAAEQCGRLTVPEVTALRPLEGIAEGWPAARTLLFCDEAGEAPPLAEAARGLPPEGLALLVGPEGGFEAAERAWLRGLAFVRPASLGPRILRAETAAIAGLAILLAAAGGL